MTAINRNGTRLFDDPQELGLNISNEQLEEMRGQLDNIDFQEAAAEERKVANHQDEVSSS